MQSVMATHAMRQAEAAQEAPPATARASRWQILLLVAVTVSSLGPFMNRAFNVDEPLFIWAAHQICHRPFDFYGFSVNWYSRVTPMAQVMKNPPLASYYIALASKVVGWSEKGLHIAFWLPALGLVIGMFRLGQMVSPRPLLAAMLALFSPVLLISATSVMCDVMMLCLWVWAIVFWLEGLRDNRIGMLLAAALLAGASALTKYFGISLLPLMLAVALVYKRRPGAWMATLLVPVAMLVAYQLWTTGIYGHGLLSGLADYATKERLTRSGGRIDQLLSGLSFTGGACLGMMPLLAVTGSRRGGMIWLIATITAITLAVVVDPFPHYHIQRADGVQWGMLAQLSLFMAAGIAGLMAAAAETRRGRDGWLLVLWFFGTFVFAAFCNWSVNARSVLPLVPAAAIVTARRFERGGRGERWQWWLLAPAIVLSLLCAAADTAWCNTTRQAAERIVARAKEYHSTLIINGHWGFQYYLMQAGSVPLDGRATEIHRGDLLATAFNNTNLMPTDFQPGVAKVLDDFSVVPFPFLATMSSAVDAGFYTDIWGPLPYAFGAAPAERFQLIMLTWPKLPAGNSGDSR